MKKILYIATSDIHLKTFHLPILDWFYKKSFHVDIAVENRGGITFKNVNEFYNLKFPRTPFSLVYFKTYKRLKTIVETGNYDLIHCHTPLPSMVTRLAARKARKKNTTVLYTAHGFHFFKGSPWKNWLIYYPVEYLLSKFTDGIITMNHEDYNYINGKMLHKNSFLIPGMGVDGEKFKPFSIEEKNELRKKLGYKPDEIILLYVAEFIPRKNHSFIIRSLSKMISNQPNLKVIFAGKGPLINSMKVLAKNLNLEASIDFLGFRNDIPVLTGISDVGISASKHEGLPIGLLQEMFCSLPIVAPIERGHNELIVHGQNGFLYKPNNETDFIYYLNKLISNFDLRKKMAEKSHKRANLFSVNVSLKSMEEIYNFYLS